MVFTRRAVFARAALAVIGLVAAGTPARAQSCCLPRIAREMSWGTAAGFDVREPWVGVDATGGVYAVWLEDTSFSYRRQLAVSRDDGETWDAPGLIGSTSGDPQWTDAAVDASGRFVLAVVTAGELSVHVSLDQCRTFRAPRALGPALYGLAPQVDSDASGVAAVAWLEGPSGLGERVDVAFTADGGATWTAVRQLGGSFGEVRLPRVLVTAEGVVVAWVEAVPTGGEAIFSVRTSDLGGSFTPASSVSAGGLVHVLALGASDRTVIALFSKETGGPYDVVAWTSPDLGATWRPGTVAIATSGGGQLPTLLARPGGIVHAAWPEVFAAPYVVQHARSLDHGNTWSAPAPLGVAGYIQHGPVLVPSEPGTVDVVHEDYRDDAACSDPSDHCESIYLDRSCDDGASWASVNVRLDSDVAGESTHSEDPAAVVAPSGRIHVLFTNVFGVVARPARVHHVALDPFARPEVAVTEDPPVGCAPAQEHLHYVVGSTPWCDVPTFQWFADGTAIPGATSPDYDVPPGLPPGTTTYQLVVTCAAPTTCRAPSRLIAITAAGTPSAVAGLEIAGLLRVAKAPAGLRLSWQDLLAGATGHDAYSGTIASLWTLRAYDHSALACHLTGPADFALDTPLPAADSYYLVAPADCGGEGSVGASSLGVPRPLSGAGAPCGPMP